MKKIITAIFISISCSFAMFGQQDTSGKKYPTTLISNMFCISGLKLYEPYLSPMYYSGPNFSFEHNRQRLVSLSTPNLSRESRFVLNVGLPFNVPADNAFMFTAGVKYSWGMHYHFHIVKNLQILAGGVIDADFGLNSLRKNVNNIRDFDAAANLNLSAAVRYKIPLKRRAIFLQAQYRIPVLGIMFVPMLETLPGYGYLINAVHFSSVHNRRGISQLYTIDIQFKKSTWRFGFEHSYLKYTANDMVIKRRTLGFVLGFVREIAVFKGFKNQQPENFISTNF
jgi:hypothetical protein